MFSKVLVTTLALTAGVAMGATSVAAATLAQVFGKYKAGSTAKVDHSTWDKLLKSYVKTDRRGLNRVNYRSFKAKDHRTLKTYVKKLEATKVNRLDRSEQFAFWVNLYNAKTIDVILDHYPVSSIRKISIEGGLFDVIKNSVGAGGPWKAKIMKVSGQSLSLDDIEHGILRPVFRDNRVHYAVNCASIGCPNLRKSAFTGSNLEASLEAGARDYINSPRGVAKVDGKLQVSTIYKWFQKDFGANEKAVLRHLRKYADGRVKAQLARARGIGGYAYDWALNDQR